MATKKNAPAEETPKDDAPVEEPKQAEAPKEEAAPSEEQSPEEAATADERSEEPVDGEPAVPEGPSEEEVAARLAALNGTAQGLVSGPSQADLNPAYGPLVTEPEGSDAREDAEEARSVKE